MSITQFFQPPLYWQQFEDLTAEVVSVVYGDPRPTKYGRPGQAQNGVDVVGNDRTGGLIGIQCKRMDELDANNQPLPGGKITRKLLNAELRKVRGFSQALTTWVLATTAKRDATIQRYALQLDAKSRKASSFGIQLWFWDDFVTDLNRYHDLQQRYYNQVIQVRSSDDQDKIVLEMLGEAFSRAAFRTPLQLETPDDFVIALKDTQHAISTGELKDRETRRVIRKAVGGRRAIANHAVSECLRKADEKLQQLREQFESHMADGTILRSGAVLAIPQDVKSTLNGLRDDSIAAVNDALQLAGLQPI